MKQYRPEWRRIVDKILRTEATMLATQPAGYLMTELVDDVEPKSGNM